jgi:hypothetical protein
MSSCDLSRACWRCKFWGGLVRPDTKHSLCSRLNASPVQADPTTGCDYWEPGVGDELPRGWAPVGFRLERHNGIWGPPLEPLRRPTSDAPERPHLPCEQFAFDQKAEAAAWRATGELLNRARGG